MKKTSLLWSSISILIGGVIAVLALVRGAWQLPLLIVCFVLWGLWLIYALLLPAWRSVRELRRRERRAERERNTMEDAGISDSELSAKLLRNVNFRISAYLKSAYPDARWEWAISMPALFAVQGGTGRIRIYGIPNYDYGDVTLDSKDNISCVLVKVVPLTDSEKQNTAAPPNQQPVDPRVWYEVQGRKVLETLVADLNSKGYYDLSAKADCARFVDREDVPSYAGDAFNWAVSNGIISGTDEQALLPNALVTRAQMAAMIARFDQCGFIRQQATSSGIKMIYPSDDQKTICPKRDFYVIGEFEDSVTLPADAVCNVQFTSNKTGERLRWVYSAQKDFKDGMYVDYQGFDYSGNREELRNSCMPDLVYDGKDLSTFKDTWRKCYFNDDVFTAIVYGGTYLQDINKYDQFGRELVEFPEGNYTLEITVTDASVINTYASYEDRIVIGTIPEKVLSPFAPQTHLDFLKRYAKEHDMVCFLDPFPGYWNTEMFLPDWNWDKDYEVEIVKRWSLADRQEYFTGHINFFNWNVPVTETSYAVEIGQLTYDHVLTDPNRLTTYYYSQGETSLPKTGESTFLKMDPVPSSADQQSVYLTRVDHNGSTVVSIFEFKYNLKGNAFISSLKEPFTLTFTALNSAGEQIGASATLKIVGAK